MNLFATAYVYGFIHGILALSITIVAQMILDLKQKK